MSGRNFDWIAYHALHRPSADAAVDLATQRRFTYHAFDQRVSRLAAFLQGACAVTPRTRVASLAHNSIELFELQFACFRLGAIFVPLNWRLAAAELMAILEDCTPLLLAHDRSFAGLAEQVRDDSGSVSLLEIGLGSPAQDEALAHGPSLDKAYPASLNDIAVILYTSGTTGHPKGVLITHGMNVWNAVNCTIASHLSSATVFLCLLPLFHTAGLNVFANPVFHVGGTVLISSAFDAGESLRILENPKYGVTHVFGVPATFQFMAQHDDFGMCDLGHLSLALVGGAPASDTLLKAWLSKGISLQQAYGMTETGPLMLFLDHADALNKIGSTGKPVLYGEVRLVNAAGTDVGEGEVGELWVRGPTVTPGYWNQPDLTAASFTNGWLRTGDAARKDGDGFYFIVDRWKDMFISGGENVYPAEVENAIYQLPGVAEAAVIGMPDANWGEVGGAFVVRAPGATLTEEEVLAHCAKLLARFKVPKLVVFVEALPRNGAGKVHKPTLWGRIVAR